jgi:hypothetical protein
MRSRLETVSEQLSHDYYPGSKKEKKEIQRFLQWLANDNFTLTGYRSYELTPVKGDYELKQVKDSSLGLMKNSVSDKGRLVSSLPEDAREITQNDRLLLLTKTNSKSRVHRPAYSDYIGVKRFNEQGEVVEVRCTYDPESRGGTEDGRKVKGTIHWVSAKHANNVEVRLYDRLFNHPNPGSLDNFVEAINPDSLTILKDALVEPYLLDADQDLVYQFERNAYFKRDTSHETDTPVFNQVVTMRDSWAKMEQEDS